MTNTRHIGILGGLVMILLIAFALRVHDIGGQSLWHDEGNTYVQTTRSFADSAENASRDIHPPLYYWLITVWTRFLGDSEAGLRSLSLFASIITVAITYALGKRLFGVVPAVLAMIFISLNTFSIYYAQEARMYALLAMVGALAMWAFARVIISPVRAQHVAPLPPPIPDVTDTIYRVPTAWMVALAVLNAIGLYIHYSYPLVMLTQGILALLWFGAEGVRGYQQKKSLLPLVRHIGVYVAINLATIVLFIPQLPTAMNQLGGWGQADALLSPQMAIATILANLSVGITLGTGLNIAILFLLLFALLQLPNEPRRMWWKVALPVLWVGVSIGIFLALGLYREANLKFLLPAQVGFALWMGRGVWELWTLQPRNDTRYSETIPKVAAGMALFSIIILYMNSIPPLYSDFRRDDYRQIASLIMADEREGDAIILSAPNQAEVFRYYYTGNTPIYELPRGLGGDDVATADEMETIITRHDRIFAVFWAQNERDPNNIVEGSLDSDTYEADAQWYGGVRLVRYIAPFVFESLIPADILFGEDIRLLGYALSGDMLVGADVLQVYMEWTTDTLIEIRYKVFIQLIDDAGKVIVQRDAEPSAWNRPTITWEVGEIITDQHALIIPNNLPETHYTLIVGLYNADNPQERLAVGATDYFILAEFTLQ